MYLHADCINGLGTVTFGCVCVQCTGPPHSVLSIFIKQLFMQSL